MADTKALRKRLLRQIADLQEKLKAVEMVDALDREEETDHGPARRGRRRVPKARRLQKNAKAGVQKTIQEVAGEVLADDWTRVQDYLILVKRSHSSVRLAAVSTAMRRLVERGVAEVHGNRKEGLQYRRKKEAP